MFIESMIRLGRNAQKLNNNDILKVIWSDPFVQDFIIDLNTNQQLKKGVLGNGGDMPEASPEWLNFKRSTRGSNNFPTDKVNLFFTGDFFRTFDIQITGTGFIIIANTTIYGRDFKDRYGFDILGLNNDSIQKLIDFIRIDYKEELIRRLLM